MGLYMNTRMSLFEVFCLVATAILLWAEFSRPIQYTVDRIVFAEYMALQGRQAAQNINTFSPIRPPPLRDGEHDLHIVLNQEPTGLGDSFRPLLCAQVNALLRAKLHKLGHASDFAVSIHTGQCT